MSTISKDEFDFDKYYLIRTSSAVEVIELVSNQIYDLIADVDPLVHSRIEKKTLTVMISVFLFSRVVLSFGQIVICDQMNSFAVFGDNVAAGTPIEVAITAILILKGIDSVANLFASIGFVNNITN